MNLRVIHVGKASKLYRDAIEHYTSRIGHYAKFEIVEAKQAKRLPPDAAVDYEGERLIRALGPNDVAIALSEEGKAMNSVAFARKLADIEIRSRPISLLIGGAYGLSVAVKSHADSIISLSKMTMQHDVALIVTLEQLYRAMTIIRGENYHK